MKKRVLIANSNSWFSLEKAMKTDYTVFEISEPAELDPTNLENINPDYIFFPHWNWKIDKKIFDNFNCIGFHTAPLPIGRGGSPIQNLILNNFLSAPVCALRVSAEIDAGPVYCKKLVSLDGPLHEIFERINQAINYLIDKIIKTNPTPVEQTGEPTYFKRLGPKENALNEISDLTEIYNKIRMLDHESYPKAFIDVGRLKIEFSNATLTKNSVTATCKIKKM